MATTNYLSLTGLTTYDGLIKQFIADADAVVDAKSVKVITLDSNTGVVSFYKTDTATGTPYFTFTIPTGDISDLAERVTDLETLVGEESVASQISGAIGDLDASDSAVSGQFVTSVSEADGVITVTRAALAASDIPELAQSKITNLVSDLAGKQATVAWQSDNYDASTNKAITKSDLDAAVSGLSGAMHFKGVYQELPSDVSTFVSGDVIIVGNKEYVFDGTTFKELGDETIYAVKGEIVNADIASDAAIAQSKIANLTTDLAAKATPADITTAIQALDATESQTAGADGLALSVTEVDGVITGISGSIAANTYDAHGAAAAVVGQSGDTASANTVYGAKAYADSLTGAIPDSDIEALFD